MNIKEAKEKEIFFKYACDFIEIWFHLKNNNLINYYYYFNRKLNNCIDNFPEEICKYKILPELINALEYGSGNY